MKLLMGVLCPSLESWRSGASHKSSPGKGRLVQRVGYVGSSKDIPKGLNIELQRGQLVCSSARDEVETPEGSIHISGDLCEYMIVESFYAFTKEFECQGKDDRHDTQDEFSSPPTETKENDTDYTKEDRNLSNLVAAIDRIIKMMGFGIIRMNSVIRNHHSHESYPTALEVPSMISACPSIFFSNLPSERNS